jgi:hypothetical protein
MQMVNNTITPLTSLSAWVPLMRDQIQIAA